jgi:SAM-dependent methyltransferase
MSVAYTFNRLLQHAGCQLVRTDTLARLEAAQGVPGVSREPALPAAVRASEPEKVPTFNTTVPPGWDDPLVLLRRKWGEIPAGDRRQSGEQLLGLSDAEILAEWERARANDTTGTGFGVRGWYHELYRSMMPGKQVLDIGCGMAISTLSFAEMGAHVTFTDIIPANVELVRRLCRIKGISAESLTIERFEDLDLLPSFDIIAAIGSLINAPLAVTRAEIDRLKMHLRRGGRWLHFAYPKSRWEQEGSVDFANWGEKTDGPGTPWMEYHDRDKMLWLFEPSEIRILFECEWHDRDFNWFDIELVRH